MQKNTNITGKITSRKIHSPSGIGEEEFNKR